MRVHTYTHIFAQHLSANMILSLDSSSACRTERQHKDVAVGTVSFALCLLVLSITFLGLTPPRLMDFCWSCALFEMSLSTMPYKEKILLCKNPSALNDITASLYLSCSFLFPRQPFANRIQNEYCHFHQGWNLRLCLKSPWHILQAKGEEWEWDLNMLECVVLWWLCSTEKLTFPSCLNYQTLKLL